MFFVAFNVECSLLCVSRVQLLEQLGVGGLHPLLPGDHWTLLPLHH